MKKIYFTLFLLGNIAFAQVNLTQGLVAYYPFNGNANDVSGNNNNPSFNNCTLTADRQGNVNSAYHFDGVDNYMQIPNSASINTGSKISICVWFRATGFFYGECHGNNILQKGFNAQGDVLSGNYLLRFDDAYYTNYNNCNINLPDTLHENFHTYDAHDYLPSDFVNKNQWYSIVYTCDSISSKLYVNCKLVDSIAANSTSFTTMYDLYFGYSSAVSNWLNGDLDEVRIYNRAINQDEVNTYGGCPLSCNPTSATIDTTICNGQSYLGHTMTGIYTDTLINAAGCDSVRTLTLTVANCTPSCNNWLQKNSIFSGVTAGDLSVSGNQLTIEAEFNSNVTTLASGYHAALVSKHSQPADCNFVLRTEMAQLATATNGLVSIIAPCSFLVNKTYHVAMVYDGVTLKFYQNGFLVASAPQTGNMVINNLPLTIGDKAGGIGSEALLGYINEVRIWNVARPQDSIRAYMNTSLPNPSTQVGLLGYYIFDNLLNKQGNPAYDGTFLGTASINQTNPQCTFVADSCNSTVPVTLTGFNATTIDDKAIQLNWHTEQEINIKEYVIERAVAGSDDFVAVGTVMSKTNQAGNTYSFIDNSALPNVLYTYRLMIYESNGLKNYSSTSAAKITSTGVYASLSPNPSSDGHFKLYINNLSGTATIKILNNLGQVVSIQNTVTSNQILLDLSKQPKGSYWISIQTNKTKLVEKAIVQ